MILFPLFFLDLGGSPCYSIYNPPYLSPGVGLEWKYGVILQLFKIKKTTDILTNVCGSLMILSE